MPHLRERLATLPPAPPKPVVVARPGRRCAECVARSRSVCGAIGEADLDRLERAARPQTAEKGAVFIHEGDPADTFFNVTDGTVKLFKLLPDGRQQVTGFVGTGHFLGLAARDAHVFSAQAIEPVRLCRFSRTEMRSLLDDFPALERRLLETACHELAAAQEQMLLLGRKTARERVASFLLFWAEQRGGAANSVPFTLPMTRAEIADYLGLTLETVSRNMNRLASDGLIALPTVHSVTLRDRTLLRHEAGASEADESLFAACAG